jgi:site-specific DNA-cytosine methylase
MSKPTALGANIFQGTFTRGVTDAGFEVLGHLEHGTYGMKSAKLNFPKLEVRVGRDAWKETEYKNKVDFMFCNPPCAAWSTAGKGDWESQVDRLRYVYDCVEAGVAVRPKAWCWESVTNAWRAGRSFVQEQIERWCDVGYHVTVLLQDNQFLGAPQARQRMFLIAHRHPLVWPKFFEPKLVEECLAEAKRNERGAGKNNLGPPIKPLDPLWMKRLWPKSRDYNGYLRHTYLDIGRGPKALKGSAPSTMTKRLYNDRVAPVMIRADHRLHPDEPRRCSWQEWLQFTGLPPTWKTSMKNLDAATLELGRAVLAPVGKWLATAVKKGLEMPPLKGRPTARVVDLRDPENPSEQQLFVFEGTTMKRTVPPPIGETVARQKEEAKARARSKAEGYGVTKEARRTTGNASRAPRLGSGFRIREMLVKGWDAERILKVVHAEFPGSKAKASDVYWNKRKLTLNGGVP